MTNLIVALVAAFLSLFLIVLALGKVLAGFFSRYDREWTAAQRTNESSPAALIDFLKQVLVAEGSGLRTIERMKKNLERDVVRAKAG